MDFWRLVDILNKRKWLILLSVVVSAALTYGATRLTGSVWMGVVRLVANPASSGGNNAQTQGYSELQMQAEAKAFESIARGQDVTKPAMEEAHLGNDVLALENITVQPGGPRIFELRVIENLPSRAEQLANALGKNLVNDMATRTSKEANTIVKLLQDQLDGADKQLADSRRRYDEYRAAHRVVSTLDSQLGPALSRVEGARQKRDTVRENLSDARARLSQRESELGTLPATITVAVTRMPVAMGPGSSGSAAVQTLAQAFATAEKQLARLRENYQDAAPVVQDAIAARDEAKAALDAEQAKQPAPAAAPPSQATQELVQQPNPAIPQVRQAIGDLRQQISGYQAQLEALDQTIRNAESDVQRFKGLDGPISALNAEIAQRSEARASIAARLQAAQMTLDGMTLQKPIEVLDWVGERNPPINTTKGRTQKLVLIAALCALLGVSGLVIALDAIDRRLRTVHDLERALPGSVCAAIPQPLGPVSAASLSRATEFQPHSMHAESYRLLGLQLLGQSSSRLRSILVTAAKAGQGCTNTVTNLGITLAQAGRRVIIVDANMRTPRLHQVFEVPNEFGFSDLLMHTDAENVDRAVQATSVPNLSILPSGATPGNVWELLRSRHIGTLGQLLRERADFVLFDTPSALAFADALSLTPVIDAAFLCMRALEPPTGAEDRLLQSLKEANVAVLGTVLCDVPASVLDSYATYQRYYPTAIQGLSPGRATTAATQVMAGPQVLLRGGPLPNGNGHYANGNGGHHQNGGLHQNGHHDGHGNDGEEDGVGGFGPFIG